MMYMYVVCVGSCFYKVSLNYGVDGGGGGGGVCFINCSHL